MSRLGSLALAGVGAAALLSAGLAGPVVPAAAGAVQHCHGDSAVIPALDSVRILSVHGMTCAAALHVVKHDPVTVTGGKNGSRFRIGPFRCRQTHHRFDVGFVNCTAGSRAFRMLDGG